MFALRDAKRQVTCLNKANTRCTKGEGVTPPCFWGGETDRLGILKERNLITVARVSTNKTKTL